MKAMIVGHMLPPVVTSHTAYEGKSIVYHRCPSAPGVPSSRLDVRMIHGGLLAWIGRQFSYILPKITN
jgi:hypothetical protein